METKQEQYFEVGMRVWDVRFGEGVVDRIEININFPIRVKFENAKHGYKDNGFWGDTDKFPSLFQTAPIITPNVPIIKFEQGELVWVRNGIPWNARFYSHSQFGEYACFENQQKEGSTVMWQDIRKFADNPFLTP